MKAAIRAQARIEWARINLMGFIQYVFPSYQVAPHNQFIVDRLMAVDRRDIIRLLICMPPRYGKSTLVCYFLAWCLGRYPEWPVIYASYAENLAVSKSRAIRRIILSPEYQELFPNVSLSTEAHGAKEWELDNGKGGLFAAGVGTGITGRGFVVGVLDDLIKGRASANSSIVRETTWDWYENDFLTRMEEFGDEKAVIIHIATRWNPDDPVGRMLNRKKAGLESWEFINLPAIAGEGDLLGREPGVSLWPQKHSLSQLRKLQKGREWVFESLYQQNPLPPKDSMIQRSWFKIVNQEPPKLDFIRYWDLASTEAQKGKDPDWTAGALVGESKGQYWIVDMKRIRATPLSVEQLIRKTALEDRNRNSGGVAIYIEQEGGASGKIVMDHYARNVLGGFAFHADPVTRRTKLDRADPFLSATEHGNVHLVRGPWNELFLEEIELFPNGSHDDMVDAVSGAFQILVSTISPDSHLTKEERMRLEKRTADPFYDMFGDVEMPSVSMETDLMFR